MNKKLFQNILLLFTSSIFCLIILELGIRIISPPPPFDPNFPLVPFQKEKMKLNIKGISNVGNYSTNKWGLRGEEPPLDWDNNFTILCVGGSTTRCRHLDDKKTWPHLLQEKMRTHYNNNIWIGNAGFSGHTTNGHLIFVEKVVEKIKPDYVIILAGFNDLGKSISQVASLSNNPRESTGLKYYLYSNLRLVQIFYLWVKIIKDKPAYDLFESVEYKPNKIDFKPDSISANLNLSLPTLIEFEKNIKKIIIKLNNDGIKPLFLTHPMLWEDNEYWSDKDGTQGWVTKPRYRLTSAQYANLLKIFNKKLIEICTLENIDYFDLAKVIPNSFKNYYDNVHYTEQGSELVATAIFEYLRTKNMSYTK
tara:strand:+ start:23432 stop:24523 length:1092 start_codon:yes stop_codon:yes gene_type:complete